jgi:hypothetical protein
VRLWVVECDATDEAESERKVSFEFNIKNKKEESEEIQKMMQLYVLT